VNIYVGNLSYNTGEESLRNAFENYGEVASVNVIKDRMTGQSRGFAFVEMPSDDQAQSAIDGLNGQELDGRQLRINIARRREERRGPRD
jgi:RNA recognition motif-containing protein